MIDRLDSPEALDFHLGRLLQRDRRLKAVVQKAGPFELRKNPRGFAGMAKVICGQQLSVASARAIWARYEMLPGALDPEGYLELSEEQVRAIGFSRGKFATVRNLAEAIVQKRLDFAQIEALPAPDAVRELIQLKGIGPWTAEIYLMFCAAHPDIFPSGDLALQKAVHHAFALEARPDVKTLNGLAERWAPHRATAALLFWRYYAAMGMNSGVLL